MTNEPSTVNRALQARLRRTTFIVLLLVLVVYGARTDAMPESDADGPAGLLFPLVPNLPVALWCRHDGAINHRSASSTGLAGIFFTGPIGLFVYCVWSRGVRGILVAFGLIGAAILAFAGGAIPVLIMMALEDSGAR